MEAAACQRGRNMRQNQTHHTRTTLHRGRCTYHVCCSVTSVSGSSLPGLKASGQWTRHKSR